MSALLTLLAASLAMNVSVIDDLFVDCIALGIKRQPSRYPAVAVPPTGVFIANWQEAEILPVMMRGNLAAIADPNIVFYLGVYPNDAATRDVALGLQAEFPARVSVIVNSLPGPTSKGQMLNEMFARVWAGANVPAVAVLHDSEDRIDPGSFPVYATFASAGYDFIQTPVYSLPSAHRSMTGATYEDGFAELHTRGMIVRSALGVAVPAAGVGTGMTRALVEHFISTRGTALPAGTLVEDYVLGHEAYRAGFRCVFTSPISGTDLVGTREYFPANIDASIRQKSRWIYGIVFDGTKRLGWYGSVVNRWFLLRDRKAALTGFLGPLATLFLLMMATEVISFEDAPDGVMDLLKWSMMLNLVGMCQRYWSRMVAHQQVYGNLDAVGILLRWPVEMYVDFRALLIAWQTYVFDSRFATRPVTWVKTTHHDATDMFNATTRVR